MKYGVLGCGFMGSAIVRALCKTVGSEEVVVYNPTATKSELLSSETGCLVEKTARDVILKAQCIFLCMKPQDLDAALAANMDAFRAAYDNGSKTKIASVVAAYNLDRLIEKFRQAGLELPVVRMIPNIAVSIGQGVILMAGDRELAADLCEDLSSAGLCQHTTERMMDIACPVFSCSPAFVYSFIDGLAMGGVRIGMDRKDAVRLAAQTTTGCAALVVESGKYLDQLRDEACSPAGITVAGLELLESEGFRGLLMRGMVECFRRQEKMAAGDDSI